MRENDSLFQQIQQYKFAINELILFLNNHPTNSQALSKHYELTGKLQQAIKKYNNANSLFTAYDPVKQNEWQWSQSPWPWEKNFKGGA